MLPWLRPPHPAPPRLWLAVAGCWIGCLSSLQAVWCELAVLSVGGGGGARSESDEQLMSYIEERDAERGWAVKGEMLCFETAEDGEGEVQSEQLIMRSLEYAKELERIV
eukprot:COSAG01_NODE_37530_length_502_cov_1.243176_1_plen_109_part_00